MGRRKIFRQDVFPVSKHEFDGLFCGVNPEILCPPGTRSPHQSPILWDDMGCRCSLEHPATPAAPRAITLLGRAAWRLRGKQARVALKSSCCCQLQEFCGLDHVFFHFFLLLHLHHCFKLTQTPCPSLIMDQFLAGYVPQPKLMFHCFRCYRN